MLNLKSDSSILEPMLSAYISKIMYEEFSIPIGPPTTPNQRVKDLCYEFDCIPNKYFFNIVSDICVDRNIKMDDFNIFLLSNEIRDKINTPELKKKFMIDLFNNFDLDDDTNYNPIIYNYAKKILYEESL